MADKRVHRASEDATRATGDRGREARKARDKVNTQRTIGRDPEHPVAGSQAWAEKHGLTEPKTKDKK